MTPVQAIIIRRRIWQALWVALRILWFGIAAILTRRLSVKTLAGFVPRRLRSTGMSETAKLQLQSVKGTVEQVNGRGMKVAGEWYDYDRNFKAERPGKEVVGMEVDLAFAQAKGGRKFIHGFEICGEILGDPEGGGEPAPESAPETASPSADCASPKQVEFVKLLTEKAGLTDDDVEQLTDIRFKKAFADLTKREASQTIAFLGGGDNPGRGRSHRQQ